MMAFITCLRSRTVSASWEYHVWLLQRTLESILAQLEREIMVIVVCHEIPAVSQLKDPRVEAFSVDFAPPLKRNDEMCADKVLKLTVGIDRAIERGCDYVMFADGDDLVSNRISEFVCAHHGVDGWYSASEYFYRYGGRLVYRYDVPELQAGPNLILRADLVRFASVADSRGRWFEIARSPANEGYLNALRNRGPRVCTAAAVGHTQYLRLLKSECVDIHALPFTSSIVIQHPDSTSNVSGGDGSGASVVSSAQSVLRRRLRRGEQIIKRLRNVRPVTNRLRSEFSLLSPKQVPLSYRNHGLPF